MDLTRYEWAAKILEVSPDDRILEIGCGRGQAARLVAEKLSTGKITAIDRSKTMASAAANSNQTFIESGRCEVINIDLAGAELAESAFDKIFVFNINAFWMDPADELGIIRRLLVDNGRFYLFHQPPPGADAKEYAVEFEKNIAKYGFNVEKILYEKFESADAVCVISKPLAKPAVTRQ
ncbi:class I SAM-dependent methyltransferase [soil metagenome]